MRVGLMGGLLSVFLLTGCVDYNMGPSASASPSPSPTGSPSAGPSPTAPAATSCLITGDPIVFGIGPKQPRELKLLVFDAQKTPIPNAFGTWSHDGPIEPSGPREGPTFGYWAVTAGQANVQATVPGTPSCHFRITIVESLAEFIRALLQGSR